MFAIDISACEIFSFFDINYKNFVNFRFCQTLLFVKIIKRIVSTLRFARTVVLIIAVLILLFGDYRKPTIVLCCIPLLAVGIVGAMLLTGKTFDFCAIVGALGLMGMLIKNCIVLLDEIGQRCSGDTDLIAGLVVSAQSRLRPVMMASLTTILGMIPLLGDAMFGSMAATIMGGLFFSTIATLLFLPILYALFFKIKTK